MFTSRADKPHTLRGCCGATAAAASAGPQYTRAYRHAWLHKSNLDAYLPGIVPSVRLFFLWVLCFAGAGHHDADPSRTRAAARAARKLSITSNPALRGDAGLVPVPRRYRTGHHYPVWFCRLSQVSPVQSGELELHSPVGLLRHRACIYSLNLRLSYRVFFSS